MTFNADVNPRMEVSSKKVKSAWIQVPMGKSSVMTVGWQMSQIALAIINIGQGKIRYRIRLGSP